MIGREAVALGAADNQTRTQDPGESRAWGPEPVATWPLPADTLRAAHNWEHLSPLGMPLAKLWPYSSSTVAPRIRTETESLEAGREGGRERLRPPVSNGLSFW